MNVSQQEVRWLLEEKYEGERTRQAEKDIARLEKGEHVGFVIGWVDFLGCRIDLSKKPLIPRPETEYWVQQVIREIDKRLRKRNFWNRLSLPLASLGARVHTYDSQNLFPSSAPTKILDIFAGSGCIGVAVLKHIPLAVVDFAEQDEKLLKQIQLNADFNGIDPRKYGIFDSDIFANVRDTYDFILANPPYIAEAKKDAVQESVLENDPHQALFGGKDGLLYITKFLEQAKQHLKPGGVLYMEFDSHQKNKIAALVQKFGYGKSEFHKDQYGNWRYVVVSL